MYKQKNLIYILESSINWTYEANVYFSIPKVTRPKIFATIIENEISHMLQNTQKLDLEIKLISKILNKNYSRTL